MLRDLRIPDPDRLYSNGLSPQKSVVATPQRDSTAKPQPSPGPGVVPSFCSLLPSIVRKRARSDMSTPAEIPRSVDTYDRLHAEINEKVTSELDLYFSSDIVVNTDDDDPFIIGPLQWWKLVGSRQFPHIAPIARDYFSAQVSSASVERLFSLAKYWVRDERSKLGDEALDMCLTLSAIFQGKIRCPSGPITSPETQALIFRDNPFPAVPTRLSGEAVPSASGGATASV